MYTSNTGPGSSHAGGPPFDPGCDHYLRLRSIGGSAISPALRPLLRAIGGRGLVPPSARLRSLPNVFLEQLVDQRLRVASTRSARNTSGSTRIAMSSRAERPKGGRPTRRARFNCSSVSSGTSEKSIFAPRVCCPFFTARTPGADDPDRLAISRPPHRVDYREHSALVGRPIRQFLSSLPECASSSRSNASRSEKMEAASKKVTPCFSRFRAAFPRSQPNTVSYIPKAGGGPGGPLGRS